MVIKHQIWYLHIGFLLVKQILKSTIWLILHLDIFDDDPVSEYMVTNSDEKSKKSQSRLRANSKETEINEAYKSAVIETEKRIQEVRRKALSFKKNWTESK